MLIVIVLLVTPLVVFALSSESVRTIKNTTKSKPEPKPPAPVKSPTIDAPGTTTQLDLFLDDEDFNVVDLINADRRNK